MINRESVVELFRVEAIRRGMRKELVDILPSLPPYLLHLLIHEKKLPSHVESQDELFLGQGDSGAIRFKKILLSPLGVKCQEELPLNGHESLNAPGIFRWICIALEDLEHHQPHAFEFIQNWCSAIVWLRRKADASVTEITSASIPSLPLCTFISRKAIRHIPPKIILKEIGLYGLQENLYHEALHHQLTCFLLFEDILHTPPAESPHVSIPWRNAKWPLDRVFHAAWVYGGLHKFRSNALSWSKNPTVRHSINEGLREGAKSGAYLLSEMKRHSSFFSPRAFEVMENIASNFNFCDS